MSLIVRHRPESIRYPAPDPAEEALHQIGQQLREMRLERGEDIYDVADYLRIKPAYLVGLEAGDFGAMPGRPYALGFLRSYADHLGLAGDEAVAHVKAAIDGIAARPNLVYRTPLPENRRPQGALLVVSLVLAGLVYGGWYLLYDRDLALFETVAEVPEQLRDLAARIWAADEPPTVTAEGGPAALDPPPMSAAPPPAPGAPPAATQSVEGAGPPGPAAPPPVRLPAGPPTAGVLPSAPEAPPPPAVEEAPPVANALLAREVSSGGLRLSSEALQAGRPAAPAAAASESIAGGAGDPPPTEADTPAAPATPVSAAEMLAALGDAGNGDGRQPQVFGGGEQVRVLLRARESSWIQVRSDSRDYVRTRTLQPGDTFLVPDRADLALWTGNAGGLEIFVDGRPIGSLGQPGAVVRDISLDPEQLMRRTGRTP